MAKVKEFIKSHLIIISTIVIVLVILAGVGYFLSSIPRPTGPPPQSIPATEQPAPDMQSEPPSEQSPPTFEQKIEDLKKTIAEVCATGETKEVTLVFTEAEANEEAAKLLAQIEIPGDMPLEVKRIRIDFKTDNRVVAEAESIVSIFKVTLKVRALVSTEEGKPKVEVTNVNFGIIPLPKPLKEKITAFITQETSNLLNRLGEAGTGDNRKIDLEFTEIRTQEDQVTVRVMVKPRA